MGGSESFLCHCGLSTKAEWLQGQDVMSGKCGFEALSSYKSYWNSLNLSFLICKKKKEKCISTWPVEWRLWRLWLRTRWQIARKLLSKAPDKEQAICDNQSDDKVTMAMTTVTITQTNLSSDLRCFLQDKTIQGFFFLNAFSHLFLMF